MERDYITKGSTINIIFSDILGTLISKSGTNEQYEEELKKLAPILNTYLSYDNFLVFVTSAYHTSLESIVKMLQFITNYIDEKYRHKITYFVSRAPYYIRQYGEIFNWNKTEPNIEINFIDNKKESIDIVLQKLKDYKVNKIYGVGDNHDDIDMLISVQEKGGHSILRSEYKDIDLSTDKLIREVAFREITNEFDQIFIKNKNMAYEEIIELKEYKDLMYYFNKVRCPELLKFVEDGKISVDELKKELYIYDLEQIYWNHVESKTLKGTVIHKRMQMMHQATDYPRLTAK